MSSIEDLANNACQSMFPVKSGYRYEATYKSFKNWCESKNALNLSENVMLAYFNERSAILKSPASLWSEYSMLKSTLYIHENVDISKYPKLRGFLKRKNDGYKPKKSHVFEREEINNFFFNASDDAYLLMKTVAVMGIAGACRSSELVGMQIDDLQIQNDVIIVVIPDSKNGMSRKFTITKSFNDEVRVSNISNI